MGTHLHMSVNFFPNFRFRDLINLSRFERSGHFDVKDGDMCWPLTSVQEQRFAHPRMETHVLHNLLISPER